MDIALIKDIDPFVRAVKVKKSSQLEGLWNDIDNLFIYIARGTCTYYCGNNKVCRLKAGDLIVFPPFMSHELKRETNDSIVQYIVHFDWYEVPERIKLEHRPLEYFPVTPKVDEREFLLGNDVLVMSLNEQDRTTFERLFLNLFREFTVKEDGCRLMMKSLLMQILIFAFRAGNGTGTVPEDEPKPSSWQIVKKVMEYIYLHYDEELSNETLSDLVKVSPNYLSKLFLKHTGVTLHNYLIQYRLEKARDFILTGEYNLTEAALKCGFSSIYSFSKSFKKEWGLSPSEYLKTAGAEELLTPVSDYDPTKYVFYNQ